MAEFKKIRSDDSKVVSSRGLLRILSESDGWMQKVELWLLNSQVNNNDWQYLNLDDHKNLFAETPILIAYVGDKIGDGHNFKEIRNADGSITASFMDATAERIVGYFKKADDIRTEEKNGVKWIVGIGYIWKWYAQELVKKLDRQGIEGMPISIETIIDEMHKNGTTEVFTKYQILGTTILGDDVSPAVENANIRALSAIGREEVRKMTLRVASKNENSPQSNPQNNKRKGVTKSMKLKDLQPKFNGFTVIAVDGENVALLSDKGIPHLSTAKKDGEEYIIGARDEVRANAVFENGDVKLEIPVEVIADSYIARCNQLAEELHAANEAKGALETVVANMQKAENARRKKVVKETIESRFNEIRENNTDCEIADNVCDEIKSDESVEKYAAMETENGEFCGDTAAQKDVDTVCMNAILTANKQRANAQKKKFAWDMAKESNASNDGGADQAIADILK